MSTIVTRYGKGSPLTWLEVDNNFTNLNTDKIQSGDTVAALTITSATINGGTITGITDLAVADGGTGLSSLTAGYIPFGAGTSAFGSSANLFWDNSNSRLGIGTTSPVSLLQIGSTASSDTALTIASTNNTAAQINLLGDLSATYGTNLKYEGNGNYFAVSLNNAGTLTERMRIDSSGNVGIGTSSPSSLLNIYSATTSQLTVSGDSTTATVMARYSTDTLQPSIVLRKGRGTTASPTAIASGDNIGILSFQGYGGTNNRVLASILGVVDTYTSDTNISSFLTFNTSPSGSASTTERMRIDSSGNVGIGTSNPTIRLDVRSATGVMFNVLETTSGDSRRIRFSNAGTVNTIESTAAVGSTQLAFTVDGTERMRIDSSNNVGIGTSSPNYQLQLYKTGAVANYLQVTSGATGIASGNGTLFGVDASGNGIVTVQGVVNYITSVAGAERMRIHSSGGVSIGNTTDSGLASLNVSGSMSGGYIAHAAGTTAMAFGADNVVRVTPNATATYTSTVPAAGAICVLSILTSGTTSYTITFGTGFKSTGTLATGTVSARYFNITFVSDGTNLIETSRTVAIA